MPARLNNTVYTTIRAEMVASLLAALHNRRILKNFP